MQGNLLQRSALTGLATALVALTACDSDRAVRPAVERPLSAARSADPGRAGDPGLRKLEHIVVIYLENRSFDNLYGEFAGANGLAAASSAPLQVDATGTPFAALPAIPSPVVPDEPSQRALQHREVRPPQRPDHRSGAPLLPGASAD